MSYRTIKRLFGETSLERKCRIFFGGALTLLIASSFSFYTHLNLQVVKQQYRERAQLLIAYNLVAMHLIANENGWQNPAKPPLPDQESPEKTDNRSTTAPTGEAPHERQEKSAPTISGKLSPEDILHLANEFKPENLQEYNWKFIRDDAQADPKLRPSNLMEGEAWNHLRKHKDEKDNYKPIEDTKADKYYHFEPVPAQELCVKCHQTQQPDLKTGDLIAVAKLSFPLDQTRKVIAQNNAILITLAIVTAFLAMVAAWAIVRYVIVKPVMHLKDVSDSVAHGDFDQRADIRTGDEFEELSHAFNRMLRHLVSTQEELLQVNTNLDSKVDELAQANLNLHQLNKVKNEFLATMSHELRTPLNSILGFSDVLTAAENLNERQKKYLSNIQTSGKHLLVLINDILDLAKIEAGKMEVHVVEFAAADLIERLTATMLPLAEKKNIDLQWEVAPAVPLVSQDAGKLQQILYNLLSNAVKFTPEGGRVRVSAKLVIPEAPERPSGLSSVPGLAPRPATIPEPKLELTVSDTGVGIPLEDQAMIFEKFRQGTNVPGQSDSLAREYEGTGLGLSIVKELSRLLGGEVRLESEFGKGSTFTVLIPLRLEVQLPQPVVPPLDALRPETLLPMRNRDL